MKNILTTAMDCQRVCQSTQYENPIYMKCEFFSFRIRGPSEGKNNPNCVLFRHRGASNASFLANYTWGPAFCDGKNV